MITIKEKINEANKKLQEKFNADKPVELGDMYNLLGLFAYGSKIEIGDVAVIKISLKKRTAKQYYSYSEPKMTVAKLSYEILDENANDSMSIEELEEFYNKKFKERENQQRLEKEKKIESFFHFFEDVMKKIENKSEFIDSLQHFKNLGFSEQFEVLNKLKNM